MFKNNNKAFTLIEVLIYIAIIAGVFSTFISYSINIGKTEAKNNAVREVNANLRIALDTLSQKIRSSQGINLASSTFDINPGQLSLKMSDPLKNPTVFSLDTNDKVLTIQEGFNSPVSVTGSEVQISQLIFKDLTNSNQKSLEIILEVEHLGDSIEHQYLQSGRTVISLRKN